MNAWAIVHPHGYNGANFGCLKVPYMPLKIVSLNLRHNADRWEERFPLIVDVLLAESADVIGFQEVYLPIGQADLIANALNRRTQQPYAVFTAPKWGERGVEGIAFLSRLPVQGYEHLNLPEGRRIAQRIRVAFNGRSVDLANTHLHHEPWENESIRLPQMQKLVKWMTERDGTYRWLLMGDLNALPDSSTLAEAQKHFAAAIPAGTKTFPTPLDADARHQDVSLHIDHILFDARYFQLVNAAVTANQPHPDDPCLYPSDHYGLVAEFEVH